MKAISPRRPSPRKADRPIASALDAVGLLEERLWGPDRLAEFLGVKTSTVYSWLSRGVELPPSFKVGSVNRWRESAVREWVLEKEKERKRGNFES